MSISQHDLDSFYKFARERLTAADADWTIVELADLWQLEHPSSEERAENIAAIRGALDDKAAGDRGRPARAVIADLGDISRRHPDRLK